MDEKVKLQNDSIENIIECITEDFNIHINNMSQSMNVDNEAEEMKHIPSKVTAGKY